MDARKVNRMTTYDITLVEAQRDVNDLYHQLSLLHRKLDVATNWPLRLRLRRLIMELQRQLVAARGQRSTLSYSDCATTQYRVTT